MSIIDFDKIIPDKRIARIAGKEIDVSIIPSRIALEYVKFVNNILSYSGEEQDDKIYEFVIRICNVSNKDITLDWLLDNTNQLQMTEFMQFVLEPLTGKSDDKKKVTSSKKK
jgi:hypothetical protein